MASNGTQAPSLVLAPNLHVWSRSPRTRLFVGSAPKPNTAPSHKLRISNLYQPVRERGLLEIALGISLQEIGLLCVQVRPIIVPVKIASRDCWSGASFPAPKWTPRDTDSSQAAPAAEVSDLEGAKHYMSGVQHHLLMVFHSLVNHRVLHPRVRYTFRDVFL